MITDDDMHLRKLVLTYAELDGFQCIEAENGRDAIEKTNDSSFDIVMCARHGTNLAGESPATGIYRQV